MKWTIVDNGYTTHRELLERKIAERIPADANAEPMQIELAIHAGLPKESYRITRNGNTWQITGADHEGLFYGIGKFLHSAKWTVTALMPRETNGTVTPSSSFRAIYFSVHLNNWYDEAPTEELESYLEELLLYGYNAIVCIVPVIAIENRRDPGFLRAIDKTRSMFHLAKRLGMKVGIIINPNQAMNEAPHEWDADPSYEQPCGRIYRGQHGRNLCPSIPEAFSYLRSLWITILEQYTDIGLDYVLTWPYDEGGCGCPKCRPWGARGYASGALAVHEEAIKLYPDSKFVLSTWLFDTPDPEGEYEGLNERLKTDLSFVDYVMVDSHDKFPRYPLENKLEKPIVSFPEISMWRLAPWGGRGANPMPRRFEALWKDAGHLLQGGMPYSEGMYEDILKVQVIGYFWNAESTYADILDEYISYEFSDKVVAEALEMLELIENNHVRVANAQDPLLEDAHRAEALADRIDAMLDSRARGSWRWRILYIRTKIDRILYERFLAMGIKGEQAYVDLRHTIPEWLEDSDEAQIYMQELCKLYHCISMREDRMNRYTLPPVKNGLVLK